MLGVEPTLSASAEEKRGLRRERNGSRGTKRPNTLYVQASLSAQAGATTASGCRTRRQVTADWFAAQVTNEVLNAAVLTDVAGGSGLRAARCPYKTPLRHRRDTAKAAICSGFRMGPEGLEPSTNGL